MKFTDPIRGFLLAGIGAAAITSEKSKELVDTLVKKGELTVEEGKALNQDLKKKAQAKKAEKANDRLTEKVSALSKEERDALRAKLDEVEAAEAADAEALIEAAAEDVEATAECTEEAPAEDAAK